MTEERPPDEAFHLTGDRLGKFIILSELGRGSMGVVYEAFQEDLKRKVALKILPANITLDAKQVRRFKREAESVARLRHDNVIQIYEVGQVASTHYFAMELVEGRPLDAALGRDRDAILRAATIARDAARGLAHAHERGVIHRDIKPGNLLVDRNGRVVVTDFGLARLSDSASLTSTDAIVGTPKYMSPEQILSRADHPVDGRTDVYALGATLYHVTAGRPPFDAPTVQAFIRAILEERPSSPRRLNRQIPHDLATIMMRCLEKDPADRYASATDLADDLDRFLAGERIHAKPKGTVALAAETVRRHKLLSALVVVAALAVGLTAVLVGKTAEESRRAELAKKLQAVAASEDLDVAILDIEDLAASHPGDPGVAQLRARTHHRRALRTLEGERPYFPAVVEDLELAGQQGTFWHLMVLIEAGRLADAAAAADALPEESPLRRLTLARVAVDEGRYADALELLPETVRDPDHPEAFVLSALTRGLAHKGLGRSGEAISDLRAASNEGASIPEAWLRNLVFYTFTDIGGDAREIFDWIGRSVRESVRGLARFREEMSTEEVRLAQQFVDSVLRIAGQDPVPSTALENIATERLADAEGGARAVSFLMLGLAQLNLEKETAALESLRQAEDDSYPEIDPYIYWGRSLVFQKRGELDHALLAAQRAVELALAVGEDFPDLEYLCEHAALLLRVAPPEEAQRTSEYLRGTLKELPQGLGPWVNALLSRLSTPRDAQR